MKLSGNQATKQFLAAASISTLGGSLVSARIGAGLKAAPLKHGHDPTTSIISHQRLRNQQDNPQRDQQREFYYEAIRKAVLEKDEQETHHLLQNSSYTTHTYENDVDHFDDDEADTGVLDPYYSPAESPSLDSYQTTSTTLLSSTCMMGTYGDDLYPAGDYLQRAMETEGAFYWNMLFDQETNTVTCIQDRNLDAKHQLGCSNMYFKGCSVVKCLGKESCFDTKIRGADRIECEGFESCANANLDASSIDCAGDRACINAIVGDKDSLVTTLDCHSGHSTCAYLSAYKVDEVFCTGPKSCYGAQFDGVESRVFCQGIPHPDGYYTPTCGGHDAFIEAAYGKNIEVVCSGDFSCFGSGRGEGFEIDVGDHGSITCEGSPYGNHDGGTYVCRFLDIAQGCGSYQCKEPALAFERSDFPTCNHIYSADSKEMCTTNFDTGVERNFFEGLGNDDDDNFQLETFPKLIHKINR